MHQTQNQRRNNRGRKSRQNIRTHSHSNQPEAHVVKLHIFLPLETSAIRELERKFEIVICFDR